MQSDASRSHEWRQKLVRLVAPLSKDSRASAGTAGASSTSDRLPSVGGASGGDVSPVRPPPCPPPSCSHRTLLVTHLASTPKLFYLQGTSRSWGNSFNLRSNKVADSPPKNTPPKGNSPLEGTGAPPLSSLHRPKMRL